MSTEFTLCPLCGGEKTRGETTFTADLGFGVVVVRNVPALVCDQWGEPWIEDSVAGKLEEIVAEARRKRAVVEVTPWPRMRGQGRGSGCSVEMG